MKIIHVKFLDHYTSNYSWLPAKDVTQDFCEIDCVGFLIKEDKKCITLAFMKSPGNVSCTMTIVKSAITKRRVIK